MEEPGAVERGDRTGEGREEGAEAGRAGIAEEGPDLGPARDAAATK